MYLIMPSCRGVSFDRDEIDKMCQIHSEYEDEHITNIIIETESMMTIIIIIMINRERKIFW